MKLVLVTAAFPPMTAPEGDHAYYLARHLADRGVRVHVVTTRGNSVSPHPGLSVDAVARDWSWRDLPVITRSIRQQSPDGIVLSYLGWVYNDHPMVTFLPSIAKRVAPNASFVTLFTNTMGAKPEKFPVASRLLRAAFGRWFAHGEEHYELGTLLRDSDRIIVLAEKHRASLAAELASVADKSVLIPAPPIMRLSEEDGGRSRAEGRRELGVGPDQHLIAYLGYVYRGKGIETLLEAFALLCRTRDDVRLALIGGFLARETPEYLTAIREMPARLGIADRVVWTGNFPSESDKPSRFLRAADVCVLPFDTGVATNNSSFASVCAHGVPIVTTKGPWSEDIFTSGKNVVFCPPQNPAAMSAAIASILEDHRLAARLAAGASRLSDEWFSWDSNVNKTLEAMRNHKAL